MPVGSGLGNKLHRRLKLAPLKSTASKQGIKISASHFRSDDEAKSRKREPGGRVKAMVSGRRKKRDEGEELASSFNSKATKSSSLSKNSQRKLKANSSEENSRTMWARTTSKKEHGAASRIKTATKEAAERSSLLWKAKSQEGDEKRSDRKSRQALSEKRIFDDGSESQDEQPKKRKRIRIDPYDVSNKRLDDNIVPDVSKEQKKKVQEKSAVMSKNAEFRAIQPSPSIISYVEENLLGRRRLIDLKKAGYNTQLSAPLDNIPSSTSLERERIEESIFRNKLTFFAAAKVSSSFPPPDVPEIAFAGRSNVGKSSLLNALTRQWGVARTSDKPGLTQTINFFNLGPKVHLVDLPGYGFAYAKDEIKEAWEELVKEYVSTRAGLKRVCLLIDTKWGMKPRDQELINLMERANTKYQIVLTKTDMIFPVDVARRAMEIEEKLKANKSVVQPVMMVSSKSGAGIRSLRTVLAKIARFAKV